MKRNRNFRRSSLLSQVPGNSSSSSSSSPGSSSALDLVPAVPPFLVDVVRSHPRLSRLIRRIFRYVVGVVLSSLYDDHYSIIRHVWSFRLTCGKYQMKEQEITLLTLIYTLSRSDSSRTVDSRYLATIPGITSLSASLTALDRAGLIVRTFYDLKRPREKEYRTNTRSFVRITEAGRWLITDFAESYSNTLSDVIAGWSLWFPDGRKKRDN